MSTEIQLPIFVYGTLRPGAINHGIIREFIAENGVRPATLQGFMMFNFRQFPGIVASPAAGLEPVVGEILVLKEDRYEEGIVRLDRLESNGYLFNRMDRFFADIWRGSEDGMRWSDRKKNSVRVWVYVTNTLVLDADPSRVIKSNDWMNRG